MNINRLISISFGSKIINYLFIVLIFGLPFVSYSFVQNPIKVGQELYIVCVISFWMFLGTIFLFKIKVLKIDSVDVCFFVFLLYNVFHYYCFSYFGFLYNEFWVFSSYIVLFYLFKWCFGYKKRGKKLFDFTLILIWIFCCIESIIGLLQEFGSVKSDNEFFRVVGTFINPNFLGVNIMLGLITVLYLFFIQFFQNKTLKLFLVLSAIPMLYVFYLTESRASWLALCVAVLVFFATSEKSISFIRNHKMKALGILSVIVFLGISSLYFLYKIDTDSVDGRSLIRKITLSKIEEKPIFGYGVFNFSGVYNNAKADYFLNNKRQWEEIKVGNYVSYTYNDYLQVIFETGLVGFVLLTLILFFILKGVTLNQKTRFGLMLIITFAFLAVFTSVIYNPNAMIYVVLSLAILVVFGKERTPIVKINNNFFIKGFKVLLCVISCIAIIVFYKKTYFLSTFKTVAESGNQKIYDKLDDSDLHFIKQDSYVEFQAGYEKYQEGNIKSGLEMMENSVLKSPIPRAHIALSYLYMQQNNYNRAEELLKLNVGIEPFRFEPLNNLLQFYSERNLCKEEAKIANDIINLPIKIPSVKVANYKRKAQLILKVKK